MPTPISLKDIIQAAKEASERIYVEFYPSKWENYKEFETIEVIGVNKFISALEKLEKERV